MAFITLHRGDLFKSETADTFVVTTNCKGVMGAGIAKTCKDNWPEVYETNRKLCLEGKWRPGMIHRVIADDGTRLLLVATKDEWKYNSRYEWVESILKKIAISYERYDIRTLAMSHLGCGNGKLDRDVVREMIDDLLGETLLDIELYY